MQLGDFEKVLGRGPLSWTPTEDRVIIQPDPKKQSGERKSTGGIVLADKVKETESFGTVLAVGPLVSDRVRPLYRVVYEPHVGRDIILDGSQLRVMHEGQLIAAQPWTGGQE